MQVGQQVVKGVFWTALAKFITAVLYGSLLILLPRYLGKQDFGYYSLTLSIVTFFGLFIIAGVGVATGRFVAQTAFQEGKKEAGVVILNGLLLQLLLGFVLGSALFLFAPLISLRLKLPLLDQLLRVGAFYLIMWGLVEYLKAVFVATQKVKFLTYEAVVENGGKLLLAGSVVLLGFGPTEVMLALILAMMAAFVYSLLLIVKEHHLRQVSLNWLKQIFFYTVPTITTFAAMYIFFELDSIMIAYYHGVKLTGAYNAAIQLVKYLSRVVTPLGMVLGPTFLKLKNERPEKVSSLVQRSLNYVLLIFVPISILIALIPGPILRFLYGGQYLTAASSFRIMSLFALTLSLGTVFGPIIDYLGLAGTRAKYMLVAVTANVGLNFLLIPKYGAIGAALATAFTHTPYILGNLRLVSQNCQLSLRPFLPRLLLTVVLAMTSILFVGYLNLLNQFVVGIAAVAVLYLAGLFLFKLITPAELQEIFKGALPAGFAKKQPS